MNLIRFTQVLKNINISFIILAFLIILFGIIVSTLKWKILLLCKNINLNFFVLFSNYMIGMFFNTFLPSTIGGDIVRVQKTAKNQYKKSDIFGSIFLERFFGLLCLLCMSIFGILFLWHQLNPLIPLIYFSLIILIFCVVYLQFFADNIWNSIFISYFTKKIPSIYISKIEEYSSAISNYKEHKTQLFFSFLLSFFFQVLIIFYIFSISNSMNLKIDLTTLFIVVPFVQLITFLPISFNGMGVREISYAYFLSNFGVEFTDSVLLSFLGFAVLTSVNLIGGIFYATEK